MAFYFAFYFGLKHSKILIPKEAVRLQVLLYSGQCALILSKNVLLFLELPFCFPELPFHFPEVPSFPGVVLLFPRSARLFSKSAFLFLENAVLFSRIALSFSRSAFNLFIVYVFFQEPFFLQLIMPSRPAQSCSER